MDPSEAIINLLGGDCDGAISEIIELNTGDETE